MTIMSELSMVRRNRSGDWRAKCRDCAFVEYSSTYREALEDASQHNKKYHTHYCMVQSVPKNGWDH